MIPGEALSVTPMPADYAAPDDRQPERAPYYAARDWELGGQALGDASQGLLTQFWQFRYDAPAVLVGPDPAGPWTLLFSAPGILELSGAFDTNMDPAVAYVDADGMKLWWFNPLLPGRTTTLFPGCTDPRLTLDDKRDSQRANADILLFYRRAGGLYYRQQRDRYGVERFLCPEPENVLSLGRVGMNKGGRVQLEFLTNG